MDDKLQTGGARDASASRARYVFFYYTNYYLQLDYMYTGTVTTTNDHHTPAPTQEERDSRHICFLLFYFILLTVF